MGYLLPRYMGSLYKIALLSSRRWKDYVLFLKSLLCQSEFNIPICICVLSTPILGLHELVRYLDALLQYPDQNKRCDDNVATTGGLKITHKAIV